MKITGSEDLAADFHMGHLSNCQRNERELGFQGRKRRSKLEALNQKNTELIKILQGFRRVGVCVVTLIKENGKKLLKTEKPRRN